MLGQIRLLTLNITCMASNQFESAHILQTCMYVTVNIYSVTYIHIGGVRYTKCHIMISYDIRTCISQYTLV